VCRHRQLGGHVSASYLSVGHGGEEEEDKGGVVAGGWRWRRGVLGSAPSAAAPKRQLWCAPAILGHRSGPATLGLRGPSLFFLLQWRILPDLGVASIATAFPSALVPGGSSGGRAWRSPSVNGEAGLDRVCAIFVGVFPVKVRDLAAISISFEVPFVIVTPPPF
jgi:hypothetical protein